MSKYRFSARAEKNIEDIYLYSAEAFGIRQADKYIAEFERIFDLLADNPRMGRTADDIRPGLRRHEHAGHVIFYRENGKGLVIVAIIHHRMHPDIDPGD